MKPNTYRMVKKANLAKQKSKAGGNYPSIIEANHLPVYRTLKCPLKKILHPEHFEKIENAVMLGHKIGTLVFDFVKLLCAKQYAESLPTPILDENFFKTVIRVVSVGKKGNGGRPFSQNKDLHAALLDFHTKEFLPLSPYNARVEVASMSHIFTYMAAQFATVQETNIKDNFQMYIRRYINVVMQQRFYIEHGLPTSYNLTAAEKHQLRTEIKPIKDDILWHRKWNGGYQSLPKYHAWLDEVIGRIYPQPLDLHHEWAIFHDVRQQPFVYHPYMMTINNELEVNGAKSYSPLCIRSALSPRYIKLDTAAIVDLLYTEQMVADFAIIHNLKTLSTKQQLFESPSSLIGSRITKKDVFEFHTKIWMYCMKYGTNKYTRHFLKSQLYVSDNSILTDGIGVSVLQVREDRVGKNCKSNNCRALRYTPVDIPYLEDIALSEASRLSSDTAVVGCDPGKKDIVYLLDGEGRKLRYTSQQRATECRFKKNKKATVSMKQTLVCGNGQTVEAVEEAVIYTAKSCQLDQVRNYIKQRRELELHVIPAMYGQKPIRKLRLSAQLHTQQSEDRFIKKSFDTFRRTDKPGGITIGWGNWGQKPQLRYCLSTPGIGFRRRIARKGKRFGIYAGRVNEQCTSCTCHDCHNRTTCFMKRKFVQHGVEQIRQVHGLLRCQNEMCSKTWNRNVNAAGNICEIAIAALLKLPRPSHFVAEHSSVYN